MLSHQYWRVVPPELSLNPHGKSHAAFLCFFPRLGDEQVAEKDHSHGCFVDGKAMGAAGALIQIFLPPHLKPPLVRQQELSSSKF